MSMLSLAIRRFGVELHAYVFLLNHFHLLMRSIHGNLSKAMQLVHGGFVQRLNNRRGWDGSLFRGRFESRLVEDTEYLRYLYPYIHLNPVRHGFIKHVDIPWPSSYSALTGRQPVPPWLSSYGAQYLFGHAEALIQYTLAIQNGQMPAPTRLLVHELGLHHDQVFDETTEEMSSEGPCGVYRSEIKTLLANISEITGADYTQLRETRMGQRGNPARKFAAWALRESTSLTYGEIGALLEIHADQVGNLLRRLEKEAPHPEIRKWQQAWHRQ